MASMASFRSAQGFDRSVHIPVRAGAGDSFHPAEHRQVQLAGWSRGALGGRAAHVVAAGSRQALALFADGGVSGVEPRGFDIPAAAGSFTL